MRVPSEGRGNYVGVHNIIISSLNYGFSLAWNGQHILLCHSYKVDFTPAPGPLAASTLEFAPNPTEVTPAPTVLYTET